jgi:regulator of protease activity HflC (stomatin/prohibitin superfamily)
MDFMKHIMKATKIFPRFVAIFPNEGGVFLRMGKYKKTLRPGLYFCFPIVDEIQKLDITPQVINLPNQSVTTKDTKTIAVSGAVEYSIYDPQKALLEVQNFDVSLQNLSMGIIGNYIKQRTYRDCIKLDGLEKEVVKGIRKKASDWGLKVIRFWITDMAQHRVYRLMTQDTPTMILPEEPVE